ncbi:DUF4339 domain-containing protein [Entomobacter blattae]|uniref:GYF domain-containing protein n=1 Tax=Entomobacter blattae TaxID=2762277 RepID=A0A7H1NPE3_9PROT|nr:DUF4339 domain-containing protein [Entomobacter blattae]QNT77653.1 hypothetical protein JGUZn3_04030 [Entomobacter blattae]
MSNDNEWFYQKQNTDETIGPKNAEEMAFLIQSGVILPDTLVWTEAFGDHWKPLAETPLTAHLSQEDSAESLAVTAKPETHPQKHTSPTSAPSSNAEHFAKPSQTTRFLLPLGTLSKRLRILISFFCGMGAFLLGLYLFTPKQNIIQEQQNAPAPSPNVPMEHSSHILACDSSFVIQEVTSQFNNFPMNRLIEKRFVKIDHTTKTAPSPNRILCTGQIYASDNTINDAVFEVTLTPQQNGTSKLSVLLQINKTQVDPNAPPISEQKNTPPPSPEPEKKEASPKESSPHDPVSEMENMFAGVDLRKTEKTLLRPTDKEYVGAKGHYLVVLRPLSENSFWGTVSVAFNEGTGGVTGPAKVSRNEISITNGSPSSNGQDPALPSCTVTFKKRGNILSFLSQSRGCTAYHGASVDFNVPNARLHLKRHP